MNVYFILWVTIQCYFIYFVAQIVPLLAIGSFFSWLLCPFSILQLLWVFFFFLTLPYFLTLQDSPCSSFIFPAPALQSAISSQSPGSFYWRMVLETKIWAVVDTTIAAGVLIASRFFQLTEQRNTYLHTKLYIYMFINKSLCNCFYVELNILILHSF